MYLFFYLLLFHNDISISKKYYSEIQICTFTHLIKKVWVLSINDDKKFNYSIIAYKNDKVIDSSNYVGIWEVSSDTLVLNYLSEKNLKHLQIKYLIRDHELYSLKNHVDIFPYNNRHINKLSSFRFDKFELW